MSLRDRLADAATFPGENVRFALFIVGVAVTILGAGGEGWPREGLFLPLGLLAVLIAYVAAERQGRTALGDAGVACLSCGRRAGDDVHVGASWQSEGVAKWVCAECAQRRKEGTP
jgi:hypothetical protein